MALAGQNIMFCSNCGSPFNEGKFCGNCGQVRDRAEKNNQEDCATEREPSVVDKAKKSIKSFLQYKTSTGKEWNSKVKGGKSKAGSSSKNEQDVLIFIRLLEWNGMEWNEKERILKMKRGKKVGIRISNTATAAVLREKAEEKWKAYYSNLYDAHEHYFLVYEDGQIVKFLPGTNEPFSLKRYHEESGIDYNRINLYLCTMKDHNHMLMGDCDSDSEDASPPRKCAKSNTNSTSEVDNQIKFDENLAKQLESHIDWGSVDNENYVTEALPDVFPDLLPVVDEVVVMEGDNTRLNVDDFETQIINDALITDKDCIKELNKRVDATGQFFIVARRGSNLSRCLNLWQRESKRNKADKTLRVHFTGEDGIDRGAMAKEFLQNVITDMGNSIFPDGSPVDSTHNVQKGYFQSCGEVVAVSLAQGGPPPCFLHECVYRTMVDANTDFMSLDDNDITPAEKIHLENVVSDLRSNSSAIIEHGYTGKIDQEHIGDIRRSIVVSIVSKRQLYLSQFMKGLELYGLAEMMKQNPEAFKQYFVMGQAQPVDANFVFSLMKPRYSVDGSTRKEIEERVMDNFQYFLNSLEDNDEKVSDYSEAVSWNYVEIEESSEPSAEQTNEEFQVAEITVPGMLGWLTGQRHRPINGDPLSIYVNFDHDCLVRQPNHTICFPCVGACGRELTLPVSHMEEEESFKKVFTTALSKGQAFARP